MTKEVAPAGVRMQEAMSSSSQAGWHQEPASGFASTGRGELDQSKALEPVAGCPAGVERKIVAGYRAEPAALDQVRLQTGDAPGGGTQQRGELLPRQQRLARDQGEDLIGLARHSLIPGVAKPGQTRRALEHTGAQRLLVSPTRHLMQQRPPCLDPRGRCWHCDAD